MKTNVTKRQRQVTLKDVIKLLKDKKQRLVSCNVSDDMVVVYDSFIKACKEAATTGHGNCSCFVHGSAPHFDSNNQSRVVRAWGIVATWVIRNLFPKDGSYHKAETFDAFWASIAASISSLSGNTIKANYSVTRHDSLDDGVAVISIVIRK